MPDKTWKAFEREVARIFGCRRKILSGSCGRSDETSSDSTHPKLFIEAKYREKHTVRTLYEKTKALARKEKKTPLLALKDKGKPGCLIVIHSSDLDQVLAEYAGSRSDEDGIKLQGMIWTAYERIREAFDLDEDESEEDEEAQASAIIRQATTRAARPA